MCITIISNCFLLWIGYEEKIKEEDLNSGMVAEAEQKRSL